MEKPSSLLGVRHVQAVFLFLLLMIAYSIRVTMSIAIVIMTDPDTENYFDWTPQTKNVVLSSFVWGYVVLQISGGELAARFGAKTLLLWSIGINSALTLLTPTAAYSGGWKLVCAVRVVQGLAQGIIYPSTHTLMGKWLPLDEKSRLGTFILCGAKFGTAIQLLASGYLAHYWGWSAIFFANGMFGTLWAMSYALLGANTPQTSGIISKEELQYLENSLSYVQVKKKLKTPWKAMFSTPGFIALFFVNCGQSWGVWTFLTEIPTYIRYILGLDISTNGVLSSLPYLVSCSMSFFFGFMADYLQKKKMLSLTAVRKVSNTIGLWGPALALIGLAHINATVTTAVALLCIVEGLNSAHYPGFRLSPIDMAPNFAGTMIGITNFTGNLVSIFAPLFAGFILKEQTNPDEWKIIFYLCAFIFLITNLVYIIFGTSKRQPWNEPKSIASNVSDAEKCQNK